MSAELKAKLVSLVSVPLKELEESDCFELDGVPYIKSDHWGHSEQEDCIVCFCLSGGSFDLIPCSTTVKPATIVKYDVEVKF